MFASISVELREKKKKSYFVFPFVNEDIQKGTHFAPQIE